MHDAGASSSSSTSRRMGMMGRGRGAGLFLGDDAHVVVLVVVLAYVGDGASAAQGDVIGAEAPTSTSTTTGSLPTTPEVRSSLTEGFEGPRDTRARVGGGVATAAGRSRVVVRRSEEGVVAGVDETGGGATAKGVPEGGLSVGIVADAAIATRVVASARFAGKLLEREALGFGDEEGDEGAEEHEEGKYLQKVIEVRGAGVAHTAFDGVLLKNGNANDLGENGAELSHSSGDSVPGRTITGWETFSCYDEGSGVGSSVEEKLAHNVQRKHRLLTKVLEPETENGEDNGEEDKADDLKRLPAYCVNGENGKPVPRNGPGTSQDDQAHGLIVKLVIHVGAIGIAYCMKNNGVIQAQAIKCQILTRYY